MKVFFEFLPIVVFFIAYWFKGIFFATATAMVTGVIQIAVSYYRTRKVDPMLGISMLLLGFFGGLTLILQNESFIKWKPTILYWMFAIALVSGRYGFEKNLLKTVLEKQLKLPEKVWDRLNLAWASFFAVIGAANMLIAYRFSTDVWVYFKMFGLLGCMAIFVVIQGIFLMPYVDRSDE